MKQVYLWSVFFILFSISLKAQDTIVLNNGQRIIGKHVHIRQKIYYTQYNGHARRDDSINKSEVNYVVRASGWKIPMIPAPWHTPFIITPGVGMSAMPYLFRSFSGDSGANVVSYSPVYILNVDYAQDAKYSIGVGLAWQSVKINPYTSYTGQSSTYSFNPLFPLVNIRPSPTIFLPLSSYNVGGPDKSITESISRFNIGARFLYHFRNDEEEDFYMGCRLSLSFWADNSTPAGYTSIINKFTPSIQIIIGKRIEINNFMGVDVEGGIGTPYFISAGIYFKTHKD